MPGELSTEKQLRENLADMTRRRDELERQLDSCLKEAAAARGRHAAKVLELEQTVLRLEKLSTALDEQLSESGQDAKRVQSLQQETRDMEDHIECLKKGRMAAAETNATLESEIADLRKELDAERASRAQERAQTHRLTCESEDRAEEIAKLRAALRHALRACSDLRNAAALLALDGLEIPF